jgi:hypothetical protein
MADHPQLDETLERFGFYRMEPDAPLPGPDAVRTEAAAIGFALPEDYAYFCTRYGAGAFDQPSLLPLPPGGALGPDFSVDILYALGADRDWNPLAQLQDLYLDRLPEGFLPVGTDPGGNLLLLGSPKRAGIYAWDHEHRELAAGEFDRRVADLERAKIETRRYDIDQLMLIWEQMFPARVSNPSGHGNLYRVADSFTAALLSLRG